MGRGPGLVWLPTALPPPQTSLLLVVVLKRVRAAAVRSLGSYLMDLKLLRQNTEFNSLNSLALLSSHWQISRTDLHLVAGFKSAKTFSPQQHFKTTHFMALKKGSGAFSSSL